MKTIIKFLFCLFLIPAFAQWEQLDPGVDVSYFSDVWCITSDTAIVIGTEGTILKTTDGGETWVQKPSGTSAHLRIIQFPTPETGFILGYGTFLKSTNGGETWFPIETGFGQNYGSMSCVNENLIFLAYGTNLLRSEDGGGTWQITGTDIPYGQQIQFFSEQVGFIGNEVHSYQEEGLMDLFKTEDGGETWSTLEGTAPFDFIDENIGYYFLDGLYKTIDGGNQFEVVFYEGYSGTLSDIQVIDENTIWGIVYLYLLDYDTSSRGFVKFSKTESGTYTVDSLPDSNHDLNFNAIHFANETTGYAVGNYYNHGIIWRNGNGINETMKTQNEDTSHVLNIFPNPASQEINVEIQNLDTQKVEISIFDESGKKVYSQTFFNKNIVNVDVKNFPKGIYVLKVETDKQNYSKKIIIK